jgi:PAS domain S-box-containing protein
MTAEISPPLTLQAERDQAVELLRSFVEAVPGVVYAKDADGRFLLANKGTSDLLGLDPELYIGRTDLDVLRDKEEAERIMQTDRRIMTTGRQEQIEEHVRLADGTPAIWLSTKAPLRNAEGAIIGLIGTSVDITERRRAEERERMLAQEVDHRGKNLLAVVQSVVQLTQAETIEDFVATVSGRIAALSRTHTLLAASRWNGAELAAIIREELAPFVGARAERVTIDGAQLNLRPDAAQTLALVFHELATNAAKYGALSTEAGQLRVHWTLDSAVSQTAQWNASWVEAGGPPVVAPTRRGFGSTIIQAGVERQLRGRLLKTWRPEGLLCEVSVPIEELVVAS